MNEVMTSQQKQHGCVVPLIPFAKVIEDIATELEPYITVEDDELEAIDVTIVPTKAEQDQKTRKKMQIYGAATVFGVVVIIVAVIVPILVFLEKDSNIQQTSSPTQSLSPTLQPSLSPTYSQYYLNYVDFFSNISDRALLMTGHTPQHRALQWIYHNDPAGRRPLSHPRLNQRYIAAVFYYSTSQGKGWTDCYPGDVLCSSNSKSSWFGSEDECDWYGFLRCNSDGFVQKFVMLNNGNTEEKLKDGNGLHGFLPSEFGYLENLTDLTIARNRDLRSTIPSTFSKLRNLISWVFNGNGLVGPVYEGMFDNMTNLGELYFNFNNFNSDLPIGLGNATSLVRLELVGSHFRGTIPTEYGQLQQLRAFELNYNRLTGTIPTQLSRLSSLESFRLNNNYLNGSIPDELFADMAHLSKLDFSSNTLGGRIPEKLGNVGQLSASVKEINLSDNRFFGSIPSNLALIPNIHELFFQETLLFGKMPEEICDLVYTDPPTATYVSILNVDCHYIECYCCSPACNHTNR